MRISKCILQGSFGYTSFKHSERLAICLLIMAFLLCSLPSEKANAENNPTYQSISDGTENSGGTSSNQNENNPEKQESGSISGSIVLVIISILVSCSRKKSKIKHRSSRKTFISNTNRLSSYSQEISAIDYMDGHSFEYWCADLLQYNGFTKIQVTPGSGDQGVDIIAWKDGQKYAIQCKRYSKNLGNKPIQEVNTGRTIYGCHRAAVMTNQFFTPGAVSAANAVGVQLWGRDVLNQMLGQKNDVLYRQSREYKRRQREIKRSQRKLRWSHPDSAVASSQQQYQPTRQQNAVPIPSYTPKTPPPGRPSVQTEKQGRRVSWDNQALKEAQGYIEFGSFSKKGLIEQLEYDGYTKSQAQYAASHCGADWLEQAKEEVKSYLANSGYSRSGLIEQLEYDGYTAEEAQAAVDSCGVLWKYQAYREARSYLSSSSYSKTDLIEQLEYDGFTHEEAEYAADRV